MGKLIGPTDILAATRISNGRICLQLSSSQVANEFVENHAEMIVNHQRIKVRKPET